MKSSTKGIPGGGNYKMAGHRLYFGLFFFSAVLLIVLSFGLTDHGQLKFCFWFFGGAVSIVLVMTATRQMLKILNYEQHPTVIPQKYKVTSWLWVKEMVDVGYVVILIVLLPVFPDLGAKQLIITCLFLVLALICTLVPHLFVRREAYIRMSDMCFAIYLKSPFYGEVSEKILLEEIKGINFLETKIIFHTKAGSDKVVHKNALFAFRGYNSVIKKLQSWAARIDANSH
jgi:hypothetical protein